MQGLIIKSISGQYTVITKDNNIYVCKPRGTFRLNADTLKVGDYADFDEVTKTIMKIHPRKNELLRPYVANLDKVFLVFSVKEPDLNLNLLDRLISIAEYNDIQIILVFTKLDLLEDKTEFNKINEYYQSIGYVTYSTGFGLSFDLLKDEINGNICVFAGQSGAGKSTLLNFFDTTLNLKTDIISHALGRGKHTTRHSELIEYEEGFLLDTPGFSSLSLDFIEKEQLQLCFPEFEKHRCECRFSNCMHYKEPNCRVKEAVESKEIYIDRYKFYIKTLEEIIARGNKK